MALAMVSLLKYLEWSEYLGCADSEILLLKHFLQRNEDSRWLPRAVHLWNRGSFRP